MAFVNIVGTGFDGLTSDASATSLTFISEDSYPSLRALLPQGVAWTREATSTLQLLTRALSYEFERVKRRGLDLLEETDPRTCVELLTEFESIYGITTDTTLSTAQRQAALYAKVLGNPNPNETEITALAAGLGYTITITTYSIDDLFLCTSNCNDSLYSESWHFVWEVTTPSQGATNDAILQAAIEAITPNHTQVLFTFT